MAITGGSTESGDDIGLTVWYHKPTDEEVENMYKNDPWLKEEYDEVGFIHWEFYEFNEVK